MVEIKMRNSEKNKCTTKVDVQVEGNLDIIFGSLLELEEAVWEILTQFESTGIKVKRAFAHNLHDRYLDEAFEE